MWNDALTTMETCTVAFCPNEILKSRVGDPNGVSSKTAFDSSVVVIVYSKAVLNVPKESIYFRLIPYQVLS